MGKYLNATGITYLWDKIRKLLAKEVTWSELKELRDSKGLITNCLYRITDYECTTTEEGTQSAGHQFDIIVKATSSSTLSDQAEAVLHEGDTYFANCKLNAWKLWYCLDNDTTRFAWADSTNGKGVIYRMIDEWHNDVPYDFKNIQFIRYKVTATEHSNLEKLYVGTYQGNWMSEQGFTIDTTDSIYMYTFTNTATDISAFFAKTEAATDTTISKECTAVCNTIEASGERNYLDTTTFYHLSNIVFCGNSYDSDGTA